MVANSDDPQAGQKWRWSVLAVQLRVSPVTETRLLSQTAKAMKGPPVSLRQVRQWHSCKGIDLI